ncbi:MAG TPA: PIN domain-containing protein [Candidatus Kapabacteria bacterium]|nr:PIN domain-containing protein [Candidatus Kapabacteria bacterium]
MEKIYLDVCCLCRQFDDQTNVRIALESYAITQILRTIDILKNELIISEAIYWEINKIPDIFKKNQIIDTIKQIVPIQLINESVIKRAKQFENFGFKGFDAIHIALAEFAKADYFLTTDDKLQKIYNSKK